MPANRRFLVAYPPNTRTHSGHICGTRDASRRLAAPSDTSVGSAIQCRLEELLQIGSFCCGVGEILTLPSKRRVSRVLRCSLINAGLSRRECPRHRQVLRTRGPQDLAETTPTVRDRRQAACAPLVSVSPATRRGRGLRLLKVKLGDEESDEPDCCSQAGVGSEEY